MCIVVPFKRNLQTREGNGVNILIWCVLRKIKNSVVCFYGQMGCERSRRNYFSQISLTVVLCKKFDAFSSILQFFCNVTVRINARASWSYVHKTGMYEMFSFLTEDSYLCFVLYR
jgi:hypothetical protein